MVVENIDDIQEQRVKLYFANRKRGGPIDDICMKEGNKKAILTFVYMEGDLHF